jgi:8-oxo-dGTP pyrophosphatase MutT (NUDIX family)
MNKARLTTILQTYKSRFPADIPDTILLSEFLVTTEDGMFFNRKNFVGHITTSAFIIDPSSNEILLLRHKALEKWLQPGGHCEGNSLLASALREAVEETGIMPAQLMNKPVDVNIEVPFDIDSHFIPANPRKEEDGHYHHDLRYLFYYEGNRDNEFNESEATGMKWVRFEALKNDPIFGKVVEKIAAFELE